MGKKAKPPANNRRRGRQDGYHALDGDDSPAKNTRSNPKGGTRRGRHGKHNNNNKTSAEDLKLRASITEDGSKEIIDMQADGNCLFRALSDQLYFDHGAAHEDIRADICHYLQAHETDFCHFLVLDDEDAPPDEEDASDFESYVGKMRQDGEWGGNVELVAAARLYQRNIIVYSAELDAYRIDCDKPKGPDMMVSYHDNDHYNSVRDCRMSKPPTFAKVYYEDKSLEETDEEEQEHDGDDVDVDHDASDERTEDTTESEESRPEPEMIDNEERGDAPSKLHSTASPSKTEPCPCGSGRRYKKCCLLKEGDNAPVEKRVSVNRLASEEELQPGGPMRVRII